MPSVRMFAMVGFLAILQGYALGDDPVGNVQLKVLEPLVAGEPVLMEATITNTGTEPLRYWCGGPDTYPGGRNFRVWITDEEGKVRDVEPTNGQYVAGSGVGREIKPGTSVEVPLAILPLPAGKWRLQVGGAKEEMGSVLGKSPEVSFEAKDDAKAREAWEKDLLARVRGGKEPFAQHVAAHFAITSVLTALQDDLAGTDDAVALAAAGTIYMTRPVPAGTDKAVRKAVDVQLKREEYKADLNLLGWLMGIAGQDPTDEMLEAVLAVAHGNVRSPGDELRDHAVSALRYFPQAKAQEELRGFSKDPSPRVQAAASNAIEHPWPPRNAVAFPAKTPGDQ